MAQFTINIEDDEYAELQDIIKKIQAEQPGSQVTEQSYAQDIVRGFLQARIKQNYIVYIQSRTLQQVKEKFGNLEE